MTFARSAAAKSPLLPFLLLYILLTSFSDIATAAAAAPTYFSAAPNPIPATTTMTMTDTPIEDVSSIVERVSTKADEWHTVVPVERKVRYLKEILQNAIDRRDEWIKVGRTARGIDPSNPLHGCGESELHIVGPATFGSYVNGLIASNERMAKTEGRPPPPKSTRIVEAEGGKKRKCVATVSPDRLLEATEAVGLKCELVLTDESASQTSLDGTLSSAPESGGSGGGGVAAILGAGNFDAPIDVLTELFVRGRVCVYKPNPVNRAVAPLVRDLLGPLVRDGYVEFAYGGADVGEALVKHDKIDNVVLTGSHSTLAKIEPLVDKSKPIVSELGGVNPWIVVPGPQWNRRTVDSYARILAWSKVVNNGHICASPQALLLPRDWKWRERFVNRTKHWLGVHVGSPPFYPGSDDAHSFFSKLPDAEVIRGDDRPDAFPRQQRPVFLANVTARDEKTVRTVFEREAFCPVLAEVPLTCPPDADPMAFLRSAVEYAESNLRGSLTAAILVDNKTMRRHKREFDRILVDMKYGVVGVNVFPAYAHSVPRLVWGSHPSKDDSGKGFVGNACLFNNPEKSIVRAPFNWLGNRLISVSTPKRSKLVFSRMSYYKLRPNVVTQMMLFSALFLRI